MVRVVQLCAQQQNGVLYQGRGRWPCKDLKKCSVSAADMLLRLPPGMAAA